MPMWDTWTPGFELAGRPIRVGNANAEGEGNGDGDLMGGMVGSLDDGETMGLAMSAQKRVELMRRLANRGDFGGSSSGDVGGSRSGDVGSGGGGSGSDSKSNTTTATTTTTTTTATTATTTNALLLKNMYDPAEETGPVSSWTTEIAADVRDECTKFDPVLRVHVPATADGAVALVFASAGGAKRARDVLEGRYFAGKRVKATVMTEAELERALGIQ